jgi:hypothetical protein
MQRYMDHMTSIREHGAQLKQCVSSVYSSCLHCYSVNYTFLK